MIRRFVNNYLERHRNRFNQILHVCGVPLTFVVSFVFLFQQQWLWSLCSFVGGYVLQFIGHAFEGNNAGEVVLIKRMLGMDYVEFGPLADRSKTTDSFADTSCNGSTDRTHSADARNLSNHRPGVAKHVSR